MKQIIEIKLSHNIKGIDSNY